MVDGEVALTDVSVAARADGDEVIGLGQLGPLEILEGFLASKSLTSRAVSALASLHSCTHLLRSWRRGLAGWVCRRHL